MRPLRLSSVMPALENIRSQGTEEPCIARQSRAITAKIGYLAALFYFIISVTKKLLIRFSPSTNQSNQSPCHPNHLQFRRDIGSIQHGYPQFCQDPGLCDWPLLLDVQKRRSRYFAMFPEQLTHRIVKDESARPSDCWSRIFHPYTHQTGGNESVNHSQE